MECRYCLESGGLDLCRPCLCREYVHANCVRRYVLSTFEQHGTYPTRCPECRAPFQIPFYQQAPPSMWITLTLVVIAQASFRETAGFLAGLAGMIAFSTLAVMFPYTKLWDRTLITVLAWLLVPHVFLYYSAMFVGATLVNAAYVARYCSPIHITMILFTEMILLMLGSQNLFKDDAFGYGAFGLLVYTAQCMLLYPSM